MKQKRVKDLNRTQLGNLIKINQPHLQVRKNMTLQNLRNKLNILGGGFAWITFDKNWVIKFNN